MSALAAWKLARIAQDRRSPPAGRLSAEARAVALREVAALTTRLAPAADEPARLLLPTGWSALDSWLGGIPAGRASEIVGPASCGKTTLALSILRQALGASGRLRGAALLDLTRTVAPTGAWSRELLVVRPAQAQLGLRALDVLLASAAFSVIVLHAGPGLVVPETVRVRAARLCREAGTALVACGERSLFGSCGALRLELSPQPDGRARVEVTKNRQGPLGDVRIDWRQAVPASAIVREVA